MFILHRDCVELNKICYQMKHKSNTQCMDKSKANKTWKLICLEIKI